MVTISAGYGNAPIGTATYGGDYLVGVVQLNGVAATGQAATIVSINVIPPLVAAYSNLSYGAVSYGGDYLLQPVAVYSTTVLYDNLTNLNTLANVALANTAIYQSFSAGVGGYLTRVDLLIHKP